MSTWRCFQRFGIIQDDLRVPTKYLCEWHSPGLASNYVAFLESFFNHLSTLILIWRKQFSLIFYFLHHFKQNFLREMLMWLQPTTSQMYFIDFTISSLLAQRGWTDHASFHDMTNVEFAMGFNSHLWNIKVPKHWCNNWLYTFKQLWGTLNKQWTHMFTCLQMCL